ncbi:MAG: BrnA antitoxin family protein [Candidatus Hydrogenedentes bacterium]|nr:BrnA antitoxin family protein [Candidatus Hydrogenedentota bacterium]
MRKSYDFSKGKRGAVIPAAGKKTRITIRLDAEVLDWFKTRVENARGGNYQTLINEALREHMMAQKEPIEQVLRRVIREELRPLQQCDSSRRSV